MYGISTEFVFLETVDKSVENVNNLLNIAAD